MKTAFIVSGLAGLCTLLGALIVIAFGKISRKQLGFFLGLASGVMVAVVLFDLLPCALAKKEPLIFLLGFAAGWLLMVLMTDASESMKSRTNHMGSLGNLIMLGITLHDIPEGMAIGLGYEAGHRAAWVIALGIGIHNVPEGMAMAAPLIMAGATPRSVLLKTLLVAAVTPLGTAAGLLAASGLPLYFSSFLGLASGVMISLTAHQLWPQAKMQHTAAARFGILTGILVILAATYI